jgi:hypothetical protein
MVERYPPSVVVAKSSVLSRRTLATLIILSPYRMDPIFIQAVMRRHQWIAEIRIQKN